MIRKILQHFSHKRDRGILLAVLTALGSKIGGVSLQLFALPLVIRDLGTVDFALFAIASSILAFFMFSNVGIGGYLVVAIPKATHRPQKNVNVKSLISTSLFLTVSAGYLFTAVFFVFCAKFGLNRICGEIYEYAPIATFNIIIIVISFGFVQLLSSIFNAAQNAYQELHYSNIYGGVGSLTSALCILSYFIFMLITY